MGPDFDTCLINLINIRYTQAAAQINEAKFSNGTTLQIGQSKSH